MSGRDSKRLGERNLSRNAPTGTVRVRTDNLEDENPKIRPVSGSFSIDMGSTTRAVPRRTGSGLGRGRGRRGRGNRGRRGRGGLGRGRQGRGAAAARWHTRTRLVATGADDSGDEKMFGDTPDPLFDSEMDSKDEEWIERRFLQHKPSDYHTDAILSCPACFALLCVDCQRHTSYPNQYRAMFVQNCTVMLSRSVRPVLGDTDQNALYYEVRCSRCSLAVAARDSDEVFHFYNVLPGEASTRKTTTAGGTRLKRRSHRAEEAKVRTRSSADTAAPS